MGHFLTALAYAVVGTGNGQMQGGSSCIQNRTQGYKQVGRLLFDIYLHNVRTELQMPAAFTVRI